MQCSVSWQPGLLSWTLAQGPWGREFNDHAQNIWNLWWTKVSLLDLHSNPFHTGLLLYPDGADLYFHTLNLPGTLLTLVPLLLWGKIAAYNASVLIALTLSGYAGFRLVRYATGSVTGALLGGIIIGFNPFSIEMVHGEINVASVQWLLLCIEFLLRAYHTGGKRPAILAGVFFALLVLPVAYFEVLFITFLVVFLAWALWSALHGRGGLSPRAALAGFVRRILTIGVWSVGTAGLLLAPYLVGAWQSLMKGNAVLWSERDEGRTLLQSSDLLSFFIPNREHWLLGSDMPWWSLVSPGIRDWMYLGLVMMAFAAVGVWIGRKQRGTWLWLSLALVGVVLSLGPVLRVNAGSLGIALPFDWLQTLPLFGLVRAPQRFILLTYVGLGILSAVGILAALRTVRGNMRLAATALIVCLLLLDLPFRVRPIDPVSIPESIKALGLETAPGAVLELPLLDNGAREADRMLYDTEHGRPITSAYLSRVVIDPYQDVCSPFRAYKDYSDTEAVEDIAGPNTGALSSAYLAENGIAFITVYKSGLNNASYPAPIPEELVIPLKELASRLGTRVAEDNIAAIYKVKPVLPGSVASERFMQVGSSWYALEEGPGMSFRWMAGESAELCAYQGAPVTGALHFQAVSFLKPRRVQVRVRGQLLLETIVPADGAFHQYATPDLVWPRGHQLVRVTTPDGSDIPGDVGQGDDTRRLSLGIADVRIVPQGQTK